MPSLRNRSADEKKPKATEGHQEGGDYYKEEEPGLEEDVGDEEEEEEEEEEDEIEEITRCICGDQDPPDESGLYIQCEKCSVWQHGHCVSIFDEAIVPDKYWCEKCKPDLHSIIIRPNGKISKYLPAQPKENKRKAKRSVSGSHTKQTEDDEENNADNEDNDQGPPKKKRGASALQKTREEIRYDAWVKRAIEESKKDAEKQVDGDTPKRASGRRSRRSEEHFDTEETINGNDLTRDDENIDPEEEQPEVKEETFTEATSNGEINKNNDEESKKSDADCQTKEEINQSEKSKLDSRKKDFSSESNDSRDTTSSSRKAKRGTKRGGKKPSSSSSITSVSSSSHSRKSPNKQEEDIDFSKPTKPRLPQAKSTINDMRKRVTAILEFIGRTQIDLASEKNNDQGELIKYVEDEELKIKINKIFENSNESLKLMDSLTGKLLVWEQRFGKFGS